MLFILDQQGVPSIAKIVQISAAAGASSPAREAGQPRVMSASATALAPQTPADAIALRAMIHDAATGTRVIVGSREHARTASRPAGEARTKRCGTWRQVRRSDSRWGPLHGHGLPRGRRLPALDQWDRQFRQMVHGTYLLRGAEVTLNGTVNMREGVLVLAGEGHRAPVTLTSLRPGQKVRGIAPPRLRNLCGTARRGRTARCSVRHQVPTPAQVTVTGPLSQTEAGYLLRVRLVE